MKESDVVKHPKRVVAEFNADHLSALISTPLDYCADMPLAAAGFEDYSYRKD